MTSHPLGRAALYAKILEVQRKNYEMYETVISLRPDNFNEGDNSFKSRQIASFINLLQFIIALLKRKCGREEEPRPVA